MFSALSHFLVVFTSAGKFYTKTLGRENIFIEFDTIKADSFVGKVESLLVCCEICEKWRKLLVIF